MKERYSTYKSSGVDWIGEIPGHWRISKYKYISKLYNGDSLNDEQKLVYESDNPEDRPYVSSKDIDVDYLTVNYDNGLRIPYSETKFKIGYKGGFLLCIEGGSSGRKMVFLEQDVCFVNKLCYFKSENENTKFLFYFVRGIKFQSQFQLSLSGLIGGVSISTIKNFEIPLPPLPEQEQIVKYLDEKTSQIDGLISVTEKKIELLKQKRTSLINEVVTKGLNPDVELKDSGVEWIGEIPKHWVVKKMKYSCDIVYGISPPDTTYNDEGIGKELINGPVEYSETDFGYTRSLKWTTQPTKIVPKNSLLFCLRGSTTGRLNLTHKEVSIGRGVCSINSKENQWYLIYTIQILRMFITDTFKGSTFPSVTKDDVDNYILPVPPLSEQEQIVDFIDTHTTEIDKLVSIEQRRIETLKEYRQSLISEVVTGKIRVCEEVTQLQES